jgi:hypothetical protein
LDGAEPAFRNPDGSVVPASDHLSTRVPVNAQFVNTNTGTETFGGMAARTTSMAMNFIPYFGAAKSIVEGVVGRDIVTGEKLSTTERVLGAVPLLGKVKGEAKVAEEVVEETAELSGILRDASKGKGNYSLGETTTQQANRAGEAWVGEGASLASDGKTLVSADKLKQYRPPSDKKSSFATTGKQANLEKRFVNPETGKATKQWQANGHLNIKD